MLKLLGSPLILFVIVCVAASISIWMVVFNWPQGAAVVNAAPKQDDFDRYVQQRDKCVRLGGKVSIDTNPGSGVQRPVCTIDGLRFSIITHD